jgi:sialate O-acetylesterase
LNCKRFLIALILLLALSVLPGMAAVRLGAPFGEHMVLQQGVPVPIWGTGCPGGDNLRLAIAGQSLTAKCDWEGRWLVILAPMKAGGPYQLLIEVGGSGKLVPSSAANARGGVELNDVVVGEVRVIPAHSFPATGASKDAASGKWQALPGWIRVYKASDDRPIGATSRWTIPQPWTKGNYEDAAYTLARDLYQKLGVPIGVIESSASR